MGDELLQVFRAHVGEELRAHRKRDLRHQPAREQTALGVLAGLRCAPQELIDFLDARGSADDLWLCMSRSDGLEWLPPGCTQFSAADMKGIMTENRGPAAPNGQRWTAR